MGLHSLSFGFGLGYGRNWKTTFYRSLCCDILNAGKRLNAILTDL